MLATNKLRQRERLAEAGIPQPRFWVVGGEDPLPAVTFPCVVKAPDQQGQKGLSLVDGPDGLGAAVETARAVARSGVVLVEELVDGPEVTVVGLSVEGSSRRSPSTTGSWRSRPPSGWRSPTSFPARRTDRSRPWPGPPWRPWGSPTGPRTRSSGSAPAARP